VCESRRRDGYLVGGRAWSSRETAWTEPLTARVWAILESRKTESKTAQVFAESAARPMLGTSPDHLHKKLRETLKMPNELVLYCLRHTYATRLGEAGADVFTIMRLMEHSRVAVSQRHVHPTRRPWRGRLTGWKG